MGEIRDMLKKFQTDEVNLYESRSSVASRDRIVKDNGAGVAVRVRGRIIDRFKQLQLVLVRRQLAKLEGIETRIRSIIENILDGMITVDEQGIICSMNRRRKKCSVASTTRWSPQVHETCAEVLRSRAEPIVAPGTIWRSALAAPPWRLAAPGATRPSRSKFP